MLRGLSPVDKKTMYSVDAFSPVLSKFITVSDMWLNAGKNSLTPGSMARPSTNMAAREATLETGSNVYSWVST